MIHRVPFQPLPFCDSVILTHTNSGTTQKDQANSLWDKLKTTSGRWQVKINLQGTPDIKRASSCCTDPRADPSSQPHMII